MKTVTVKLPVELKPYPEMGNDRGEQKSKAFHVYVNGVRAGYIWKQQDTRTCRFPWAAFAVSKTRQCVSLRVANFLPEEGGKRAAVKALVAAALADAEPVHC